MNFGVSLLNFPNISLLKKLPGANLGVTVRYIPQQGRYWGLKGTRSPATLQRYVKYTSSGQNLGRWGIKE